jgi:hypothetical protein
MLDPAPSEDATQISQTASTAPDGATTEPSQSTTTDQQPSTLAQPQQVESSSDSANNEVSAEEDSSMPTLSSMRRGSSLNNSNPVSLPPPPTTSSSGNPSITKMQRRASRLSINIDLSAAAAVAAATTTSTASTPSVTNPSGIHSTTTATTTIQPPINTAFIPQSTSTVGSIFNTKPFAKVYRIFLLPAPCCNFYFILGVLCFKRRANSSKIFLLALAREYFVID